jgi:hypothetical protein
VIWPQRKTSRGHVFCPPLTWDTRARVWVRGSVGEREVKDRNNFFFLPLVLVQYSSPPEIRLCSILGWMIASNPPVKKYHPFLSYAEFNTVTEQGTYSLNSFQNKMQTSVPTPGRDKTGTVRDSFNPGHTTVLYCTTTQTSIIARTLPIRDCD